MRFPRNAKIFRGQWDATPFAAVFFLMAILFLFSFRQTFTPGVHVELPKIGKDLPGTALPVEVVVLDANGRFYYRGQGYTNKDALIARLKAATQRSPEPVKLMIQADGHVPIEQIMSLAGWAPELGFQGAVIGTQR